MGFKTIDLNAPGGYERYNKMKETNSVKKAFEDEEPLMEKIERQNEEALEEIKKDALKNAGLKPDPIPEPEQPTITTQDNIVRTGVVRGVSQLRVRIKPEGDILYLISEKSIVKILEDLDGWYKVETAPGRQGYVMKQYIEVRTEGG